LASKAITSPDPLDQNADLLPLVPVEPGCSPRSYIALAELERWLLLSLRLLNELTARRPSNAFKLTSCSTKCLPA
jgi:hypothetical protein